MFNSIVCLLRKPSWQTDHIYTHRINDIMCKATTCFMTKHHDFQDKKKLTNVWPTSRTHIMCLLTVCFVSCKCANSYTYVGCFVIHVLCVLAGFSFEYSITNLQLFCLFNLSKKKKKYLFMLSNKLQKWNYLSLLFIFMWIKEEWNEMKTETKASTKKCDKLK